MPEIRESVILAALAVILISIPAASQNVEITEEDRYSGKIDSRFSDMFKVDFRPGKIVMELIDSEARLQVNKSYRKNTYLLRTPEGYVKKVETSNSTIKIVQTPYGRFVSGFRNGENISKFESSREEASDSVKAEARKMKKELMKRFEERLAETRDRKQIVMDRILPDIELGVEADEDTAEHFVLENTGNQTLDLSGWKIAARDSNGEVGDTLRLEREISPGEKVVFYSNKRKDVKDVVDSIPEDAIFDSGVNIFNDGGAVKLYNGKDRLIDSYSY